MNEERFQELVKSMVKEEMDEHVRKSEDYADPKRTNDILDNFKAGAKELDTTPVKYLLVHMSKHIRAIQRYCRTGNVMSEAINNRIKDARNYFALLRALIEDGSQKAPTSCSSSSSYAPVLCPCCSKRISLGNGFKFLVCSNCGRTYRVDYTGKTPVFLILDKVITKEKK